MGCTLVIDTSFGSTVGIVGREPIVETDSRTHVEKLQVNIARAVEEAGFPASDIATVIVGTGPAPFTGLRAGIVTAKALAFRERERRLSAIMFLSLRCNGILFAVAKPALSAILINAMCSLLP